MSTTYQERVLRYRIMRHEELPETHKAEYRLNGIDPDTVWSLIWSFETREAAEAQLADCNAHKGKWQTYKLVDAGEATTITRTAWF